MNTINNVEIAMQIVTMPRRFHSLGNISIFSLLEETGYFELHDQVSESDIRVALLRDPECVQEWMQYCSDKRTSSGWFIRLNDEELYEVGYFDFVREEEARCYGRNGNESVPPKVILKVMFLLFFDDIKSERELMEVIGERLDYLWFLDYGLDEKVPDHSVLSKARVRWGRDVFESLFVRTVAQCVEGGLVDGSKLHVDASLIDANASKESVTKGPAQLIEALKRAYSATESKLEGTSTPQSSQAV